MNKIISILIEELPQYYVDLQKQGRRAGICVLLSHLWAFKKITDQEYDNTLDFIKENKPEGSHTGYWWKHDNEGLSIRMEFLKTLINEKA